LAKNYFPQNTKKGIFCASLVPITVYNWGMTNNKPQIGDSKMISKLVIMADPTYGDGGALSDDDRKQFEQEYISAVPAELANDIEVSWMPASEFDSSIAAIGVYRRVHSFHEASATGEPWIPVMIETDINIDL
jgi:hypothetical protein